MSLWSELKRRNVLRVAAAYLVVGWLLLQVTEIVLGYSGAPEWIGQALIVVLVLGFPPVIALSWIYESTRGDVERDGDLPATPSKQVASRRLDYITIGAVVGLAFLTYYQVLVEPTSDGVQTRSKAAARPANPAEPSGPSAEPVSLEPPPPNSIAVLPFANMSTDPENEYFSDGISEEILNVLSRVPGLRVAARTSAFQYKGANLNVAEIGRKLRVAHVLEGSVRRQGERVRVTAQLIQAGDGFHEWSETFDRTLDDIFAIQDEIAVAIADSLQVELGLSEGNNRTGTENLGAYELYLRGVHHWYLRTYDDLVTAIGYFKQAIAADPDFAKAHAGLAMTYAVIGGYGDFPGSTGALARSSAEQALKRDPSSIEAMAALALSRSDFDKDVDGGIALLRRAIEINPNFATGRQWLGNLLSQSGQPEAALESLDRAVELDPGARVMGANRAAVLYLMGRLDEALAEAERVLLFAPDHFDSLMHAANVSLALGDRDRHRKYMQRLGRTKGDAGQAFVGRVIAAYDDAALRGPMIEELQAVPIYAQQDPGHPSPFRGTDIPVLLVRLGSASNALSYLVAMHEQGHQDLAFLLVAPDLEPLRCEPPFQSILADTNVTPYWDTRNCETPIP